MTLFRFFLLTVLVASSLGIRAQDSYPSKSVRLIAAAAPGGNPDVLARMLGAKLSDSLGRPFVVENLPGFVPKGKVVVLGLVSTKVPELETVDLLKKRIDEATKYLPLEQLAVSPQCGFGSDVVGNLVSEDDQKRRLERVVEVARQVWQ